MLRSGGSSCCCYALCWLLLTGVEAAEREEAVVGVDNTTSLFRAAETDVLLSLCSGWNQSVGWSMSRLSSANVHLFSVSLMAAAAARVTCTRRAPARALR